MSGAAGKAPSSVAAPPQGNVPHQPLLVTLQSGAPPPLTSPFPRARRLDDFQAPPAMHLRVRTPAPAISPLLENPGRVSCEGGWSCKGGCRRRVQPPPLASSPTQTSVRGGEMKMDGKPELEGSLWGAYMCSLVGSRF
jgi:hypothetical protein